MKKLLAIIGALISWRIRNSCNWLRNTDGTRELLSRIEGIEMRKVLAIIGALIGGGLGIALINSGTQAAHAAMTAN